MKDAPCNVCGSTDLNLVDGFYYCVECGTQDVNVRETVVEQTFLADGTVAFVTGKKFSIMVKDGIEMSGEWYKWHAYNFILHGLTEELIKLRAKPSVKMKVLWIWTRYMREFQEKKEGHLEVQSKIEDGNLNISQSPESEHLGSSDSESEDEQMAINNKKHISRKYNKNIKIITKGLLLSILYLALNFDKSHIQLSHLFRFIKEDRLSLLKCTKFVPKEIETKLIPHWINFLRCQSDYNSHTILRYAMTCIRILNLGCPIIPDFNKMIHCYIKELCLPKDFKNLVLSLMLFQPYDNIKIDKVSKYNLASLPDYEVVAMSYILVALKMCFGLDGDYEGHISDIIDKINDEENHLKSCKLGMYSEPTDRLFSFHQWTRFLQFRKILLCQYYLPMARYHNLEVDDYVLMEHMEERNARPIKLRDEVTMDILNKIPYQNNINIIPKSEFLPCLTPMSTYTDVVLNFVLSDELRLLLSEDFSQYNLKYATEDLKLFDDMKYDENFITGINESNKKIEPKVKGEFESKQGDMSMVFIRNCENKNWLKTKPPALEHIKQISENEHSDRDSDHGYDSNSNDTLVKNDEWIKDEEDIKLEYFDEEQEGINIFDDNYDLLANDDKSIVEPNLNMEEPNMCSMGYLNNTLISECDSNMALDFNAITFDKDKLIDELISSACKKYKIRLPPENVTRQPRKRKCKEVNTEVGECAPKRRKPTTKPGEIKQKINDMIGAYYTRIENDILIKVTERVRNAIERQENYQDVNNTSEHLEAIDEVGNNLNHEQLDDHLANNSLNPNEVNSFDSLNQTNIDEDQDLDADIKQEDPEFDAKTHDIGQLYVKLNDDVAFDESVTLNEDPQIDEIILSTIEKMCYIDNIDEKSLDDVNKNEIDLNGSSSDDDSCDAADMIKLLQEKKRNEEFFTPLIRDTLQINVFNYWLRHYSNKSITQFVDVHYKFDLELKEHFPASFRFVINECADMLGCSAFNLYRSMQNLEKNIIGKSNILPR